MQLDLSEVLLQQPIESIPTRTARSQQSHRNKSFASDTEQSLISIRLEVNELRDEISDLVYRDPQMVWILFLDLCSVPQLRCADVEIDPRTYEGTAETEKY